MTDSIILHLKTSSWWGKSGLLTILIISFARGMETALRSLTIETQSQDRSVDPKKESLLPRQWLTLLTVLSFGKSLLIDPFSLPQASVRAASEACTWPVIGNKKFRTSLLNCQSEARHGVSLACLKPISTFMSFCCGFVMYRIKL